MVQQKWPNPQSEADSAALLSGISQFQVPERILLALGPRPVPVPTKTVITSPAMVYTPYCKGSREVAFLNPSAAENYGI